MTDFGTGAWTYDSATGDYRWVWDHTSGEWVLDDTTGDSRYEAGDGGNGDAAPAGWVMVAVSNEIGHGPEDTASLALATGDILAGGVPVKWGDVEADVTAFVFSCSDPSITGYGQNPFPRSAAANGVNNSVFGLTAGGPRTLTFTAVAQTADGPSWSLQCQWVVEVAAVEDTSTVFDPDLYTVDEAIAYAEAHPDEVQAIYDAESDGKGRVTLLDALRERGAT